MANNKNNNKNSSRSKKSRDGSGRGMTQSQAIAPVSSRPIVRLGTVMKQIQPTSRGIRVRNSEQVDYVTSQNTANSYVNIPFGAKFAPFAWLTGLAVRYQYFRVHRIKVTLFSNCPSTQRGDFIMAWCPDTVDASSWVTAASPNYIYNYPLAVSGPCWAGDGKCLTMTVGPQDLTLHSTNPWKRIGTSATTDGQNQLYAGSILYQAGSNQSGSAQGVGNMFVEYDIEFAESANSSVNFLKSDEPADGGIQRGAGPDTNYPRPPPSTPKPLTVAESSL